MKVYSFGAENAPVILLLPGTCCHWKGNFGRVIPLLSDRYRVLCVSYDGFDETEHTEFPTMLEETEKIEAYIQEHSGGHIRVAYGCSLGGSFVGLLAARGNIHMDYGILGSSDLDQASPFAAKLQTNLLLPLIYPVIRDGQVKSRLLQKRLTQRISSIPTLSPRCRTRSTFREQRFIFSMRSKWVRNTASAMNGTLQTQPFTSRTCSTRSCWPVIRSAGCSW